MAQTTVLHPTILWAQRNDTILMTVNLTDIHDEKISLEDKVFTFAGTGGSDQKKYGLELEFFKEVIPQESKHKKTDRGVYFVIRKKEPGPYWPRLLSDSKKCPFVKTDFNRWKDEDESGDEGENPMDDSNLSALMQQMGGGMGGAMPPGMGGGMPPGMMGGMPGMMGGMGGMMGGMGGMPGMGGMMGGAGMGAGGPTGLDDLEDSDSDDEPLPDLEQ